MLRIGIIGCGWVSDFGHGPALKKYVRENSDWELTGCCDTNADKAREFRSKYGFKHYFIDYHTMIQQIQPDVLFLNVPEKMIAPLSIKILKKGIALFLEKPPGTHPAETRQMIDAVKKYGTPHQVAFNRRYMPMIQKCQQLIQDTCKPESLQNIEYQLFRVNRRESHFEDTTIHGIDTVRYLAHSDFQQIHFFYQPFSSLGENVQNIYLNSVMESGATAQLAFCPVSGAVVERVTINALDYSFFLHVPVWDSIDQSGHFQAFYKNQQLTIHDQDILAQNNDFEKYGFYAEDKAFLDAIRSNYKPEPDIESSFQTVEIIDCIRKKNPVYMKRR